MPTLSICLATDDASMPEVLTQKTENMVAIAVKKIRYVHALTISDDVTLPVTTSPSKFLGEV
ncbi:MAG: hypothetical protein ACTSV6_05365, partial [Candidatus Heimdallarchaeota archaeon]